MVADDLHTIDDFIAFYSAIPEDKWCENMYGDGTGRHCALGHIGGGALTYIPGPVRRLCDLAKGVDAITLVNDNRSPTYQQHSPKARILALLEDIKRKKNDTSEV